MQKTNAPWHELEAAMTAEGFWWMTGFEGSHIPLMEADEYTWTQHDQQWADDLSRVSDDLGIRRLRYTIPWQKVNPERGSFDWDWADRVMAHAEELSLTLVLNPIQFGTPTWLPGGFSDPDFPHYAVEYVGRLAERYGRFVKFWTPHNEPLIAALFSGDLGHWPPYAHGLRSYMRMVEAISRQMVLCVNEIRRFVPDAIMVHVDAGEYYDTHDTDPVLLADIALRNERRFLFYDMISGRIGPQHPLAHWLAKHGITDTELAWFQDNRVGIDVLGIDFYPHNGAWLEVQDGKIERICDFGNRIVLAFEKYGDSTPVRDALGMPIDLSGLLRQYYERYHRPIILTETNYCGLAIHKVGYIGYSVSEVRRAREAGVPVLGYTWWPAVDHLNWNNALKERNSIHPVGLWELKPDDAGNLVRHPTLALDAYRRVISNPARIGTVTGNPTIRR